MKKVVNLATNYMSALCETGRVSGQRCGGGHRKPGGLRTGIKRIFPMNSHTTNAYPITKEVHDYLLPVYERGRLVKKAGIGNDDASTYNLRT